MLQTNYIIAFLASALVFISLLISLTESNEVSLKGTLIAVIVAITNILFYLNYGISINLLLLITTSLYVVHYDGMEDAYFRRLLGFLTISLSLVLLEQKITPLIIILLLSLEYFTSFLGSKNRWGNKIETHISYSLALLVFIITMINSLESISLSELTVVNDNSFRLSIGILILLPLMRLFLFQNYKKRNDNLTSVLQHCIVTSFSLNYLVHYLDLKSSVLVSVFLLALVVVGILALGISLFKMELEVADIRNFTICYYVSTLIPISIIGSNFKIILLAGCAMLFLINIFIYLNQINTKSSFLLPLTIISGTSLFIIPKLAENFLGLEMQVSEKLCFLGVIIISYLMALVSIRATFMRES